MNMKKEINIIIKMTQKDMLLLLVMIGVTLILVSIIPMWLVGIVMLASVSAMMVLNEFNKGM